ALAAIHACNQALAASLMTELAPMLGPRTPDVVALPPYLAAAEFALRFRDRALAKVVAGPLAALAAQEVVFTTYWPVLLVRMNGGLAALTGDFEAASTTLKRALSVAEGSGALAEQILVQLELAWLALLRGGSNAHAGALASARSAEATCRASGLDSLLPRVRRVLDELETAAV
ncbi:MAG: hypothetical protein ACRDG3_13465, partial [Tepidiformaceae bacterium]